MIIEVIVLSGIFGVGYSIFKKEETRFEKQALDDQKKRNSALKQKLHVEGAPTALCGEKVTTLHSDTSDLDITVSTRVLSRSPRDLALLGSFRSVFLWCLRVSPSSTACTAVGAICRTSPFSLFYFPFALTTC